MESKARTQSRSGSHNYGSNCELILCAPEGEPTKDAFDYFYRLLTTYRYPMRYLKKNQDKINALGDKERKQLEEDELDFIRVKLKEKFPEHSIFTLPKSLYQLHAFCEEAKPDEPRLELTSDNYKNYKASVHFDFDLQGKDYDAHCLALLNKPKTIEKHFSVNNAMINKFNRCELSLVSLDSKDIEKIIDLLIEEVQSITAEDAEGDSINTWYVLDKRKNYLYQSMTEDTDTFKRFCVDMCAYENESRFEKNVHYIFQGAGTQIHKRKVKTFGQTISFGDGWFGGCIADHETGMAFTYAMKKRTNFFSITQVKKCLAPDPSVPIYIPRVTGLECIYGVDELHHPRSKVSPKYDFVKRIGIEMFVSGSNTKPDANSCEFLIHNSAVDNEEMENILQDFLKANSVELVRERHWLPTSETSLSIAKLTRMFKEKQFQKVHEELKKSFDTSASENSDLKKR